jgi:carboxylesterase type B
MLEIIFDNSSVAPVHALAGNMDEGSSFAVLGINTPAYSYLFDIGNRGSGPNVGFNHGSEVPYVFNNVDGLGYAPGNQPMEDELESYQRVADMMSRMWVSFVARLDPDGGKFTL